MKSSSFSLFIVAAAVVAMSSAVALSPIVPPAGAAGAADVGNANQYAALRKKISQSWTQSGSSIPSADLRAVIAFSPNTKDATKVSVFNTSHSAEFDKSAKESVVKALPLNTPGSKALMWARFDPFTHAVDVYPQIEPDFGPYMAALQRSIKRNWYPPKNNESKRVVVFFKVYKDGSFRKLRVDKSSGVQSADLAALAAVRDVKKFRALPIGAPDDVDIQFTFDYNVFGKDHHKIVDADKEEHVAHSKGAKDGPAEKFFAGMDKFLSPK